MMKTIELPVFGIRLQIADGGGTIESDLERETCPSCGQTHCAYHCDGSQGADDAPKEDEDEVATRVAVNTALDTLENFVLAAACAGIDVESPAFLEAIETVYDGIASIA